MSDVHSGVTHFPRTQASGAVKQRSLALADHLVTRDLRLTFVKDGEHRLSRPQDLALLCGAVEELCDSVA